MSAFVGRKSQSVWLSTFDQLEIYIYFLNIINNNCNSVWETAPFYSFLHTVTLGL